MENFVIRARFYPENGDCKFFLNLGLIYQHNQRHFLFDTLVICMNVGFVKGQ